MRIRHAEEKDIPRMMEIYRYAREFMAAHGNPNQWGPTNWPPEELIRRDIRKEHSYVACCGTSLLPVQKMLERMPRVDTVFLCLDNDSAGHEASERFAVALSAQGVETERLVSERKDWNEDLVEQSQTQEVRQVCQTMCGP